MDIVMLTIAIYKILYKYKALCKNFTFNHNKTANTVNPLGSNTNSPSKHAQNSNQIYLRGL